MAAKNDKKLRTIPQADEAEKAVLGSMILDEKTIDTVVTSLSELSFHSDRNKKIFLALKELRDNSKTIDYINIINTLEHMGDLDLVSKEYLVEIGDFVPSAANIQHYIAVVKEKELYRSLINRCTSIIDESYEQKKDVYELIDSAEKQVFDLSQNKSELDYEHVNPIIFRAMDRLQALSQNKKDLTGVDTGFSKLNQLTSGWQNSDLIIIAGRPSMGKTALVLNFARNAADIFEKDAKEIAKEKSLEEAQEKSITNPEEIARLEKIYEEKERKSVVFFSLEMGADQLVNRLITSEAMVEGTKLRNGRLEADDWTKLSTRIGKLAELPLFIDDSPGLKILELRSKCRRLKSEKNIGLVILDYLQLMEGDNQENRQQEISAISRQLKLLAKEIKVPIIALSQLSRALESRNDKRPQLSDLRESGSIEQDADIVGFIHRPEYYKLPQLFDETPSEGMAEFIIGKQRNGPIGDVKLAFLKNYGKFADPDNVHFVEPSTNLNTDAGF